MMLSVFSGMPDSVATTGLSAMFGDSLSKDQLLGMSGQDFTALLLEKIMGLVSQVGQISLDSQIVLGRVMEKDSLCHVVTRTHVTFGVASMEKMEVVSFVKRGNDWKMLLQGEFKGMVEQMKQMSETMKESGSGQAPMPE